MASSRRSEPEIRFHEDVLIWHRGIVKEPPPMSDTLDMKGYVIDVAMYWPRYDFGKLMRLENIGAGCMVQIP